MKYLILVLAVFSTSAMAFGDSNAQQGQLQGQAQGQIQGQGQSQYSSNRNSNSNRNSASSFSGSSSYSQSGALSGSLSGSNSGGNSMTVQGDTFEAADVAHIAPPVSAPDLTTGVCMGSASGGASGQGFGFSFGSTTVDEECQIRRNAILLSQLGLNGAANKILCQIESVELALNDSGSMLCVKPQEEVKPRTVNSLGFDVSE